MRCALQLLQCSASKFWSAIAAVKQCLYICKGFLRLLYCHNFCTQKMKMLMALFFCLFSITSFKIIFHFESKVLWTRKSKQMNLLLMGRRESGTRQQVFETKQCFSKPNVGRASFQFQHVLATLPLIQIPPSPPPFWVHKIIWSNFFWMTNFKAGK